MYSDSLFDEFPEVTAVDVGYRQTGQGKVLNEEDDEFHLLVWVKKKLSEEELEQRQLKILPKEFKITDCVTVDVIEGEVTYAVRCNDNDQPVSNTQHLYVCSNEEYSSYIIIIKFGNGGVHQQISCYLK